MKNLYKILGILSGIGFFLNILLAGYFIYLAFHVSVPSVIWYVFAGWLVVQILCIFWKKRTSQEDYKKGSLILAITVIASIVPIVTILCVLRSHTGGTASTIVDDRLASKSWTFMQTMQRKMNTEYAVTSKTEDIILNGPDGTLMATTTLSGYVFTFTGNSGPYVDYLGTTLGPLDSYVRDSSRGYADASVLCILYESSQKVFCANIPDSL